MRKTPLIITILYCFFLLSGSIYGIGEKTISFGGESTWLAMETRRGVTEARGYRPAPVLLLSDSGEVPRTAAFTPFPSGEDESSNVDLYLSFDEGNPANYRDSRERYTVSVSRGLSAAEGGRARSGGGAALFSGRETAPAVQSPDARNRGNAGSPLVLVPREGALFSAGSHVRDFSIEFWLYPLNMENGEQILSWTSSKSDGHGGYINQRIECAASGNRLEWSFGGIFFSPDETAQKTVSLSGPGMLPGKWSHHLVRFDSDTGLLEYLVDGGLEAVDYVSFSGHEGSEVYTPVFGENCLLALGGRFSGMLDEFRVHSEYLRNPRLSRYPPEGGRAESRVIDLGKANSRVVKIDALGGRTFSAGIAARNEYAGNGNLRFGDHAELRVSIRVSNSPYFGNEVPWTAVNPGEELRNVYGRYIQIAADFYPGAGGNSTPYLSELKIVYKAHEAPAPPPYFTAAAKDGAVELSWRVSPSRETAGYMVYYGTSSGEYFGDYSANGQEAPSSPVDAGNRTSIRIEGLNNGTLYFFAVAAYSTFISHNGVTVPEPGEFSAEAAARPLRMNE